jgi:hypothetical protein
MAQAFGVVDILVTGEPSKHRLPQQTDQSMAAILAPAGIGKNLARLSRVRRRVRSMPTIRHRT